MEIIVDKGCGLDVHKETVVACIMGTGIKKEIRTFSTMTNDLFRLKEWLKEKRKLPLTSPLRKSLQSHSRSWTSVFLPGTFLTCRALTSITSKLSSRMLNTGFQ